ncbi:MAG: M6 family metalloprotease domain-containing protein [Candidatus Latescibacteria bacterium]|nr:M6 family metalloprotease domain-containing protein [Candidatus Latescibacterota bacterium]NIO57325.1 M6 family metalloprotease domain-containing protein [Candidatus Latescibacterota bacterium]
MFSWLESRALCAFSHLCFLLSISALSLIQVEAGATIPPRPGQYDSQSGLLRSGYPPPVFNDEFGNVVRPLRQISGDGRAVALLVDFPDRPANRLARPDSFYNDLLFSQGTHPTGSLRDFYLEQSYGAYNVTGEAHGWLRTFEEYYTTFDDGNFGASGGARGVGIAVILLADPIVDFSTFDSDGPDGIPNSGDDDGYVDACIVIHSQLSGYDTLDPSDFWPVISTIDPDLETDDSAAGGGFIRIGWFSIQPEVALAYPPVDTLDSFLGVIAHEYGHLIGLPDLYDKSHVTWGIGYWGLMGYGSGGWQRTGPYQLSAWSKVRIGWVTPTIVTENLLDVTIPPVETQPVIYKVWRDGVPGDEYFLLENRQPLLHDEMLPGHGLLIWHVDESAIGSSTSDGMSPEFDFWIGLEQADGRNDMNTWFNRPDRNDYYPELGDGGDPFPGDSINTRFDDYSIPSSRDNSGLPTDVSIVDITSVASDIRLSIIIDSSMVAVYFTGFRGITVDNGIELIWAVYTDESIDGFKLYRCEESSSREISIPEYGLIPPERRRYVDEKVRPGETYSYVLSAVRPDGSELRSLPVEITTEALSLALHQNYPNPFNPSTTISFSLPREARIRLSIFNIEGKLLRTLIDEKFPAGFRQIEWDGKDEHGDPVSSGIYLYRLETEKRVLTKKMVLIR